MYLSYIFQMLPWKPDAIFRKYSIVVQLHVMVTSTVDFIHICHVLSTIFDGGSKVPILDI